jgi:hypothetical protein
MSDAAVTGIVLLVFFVAGIAVGIVIIIAMSARTTGKANDPDRPELPEEEPLDTEEPGPDDDEPDKPPWWLARGEY